MNRQVIYSLLLSIKFFSHRLQKKNGNKTSGAPRFSSALVKGAHTSVNCSDELTTVNQKVEEVKILVNFTVKKIKK